MVLSTGSKKIKTAVFISGTGSNLKSLIKFSKLKKSPISIEMIVSNNPKSKGLTFGKIYKIRKNIFNFKKQASAEKEILFKLKKNKIPFIVILTNPTTGGVTASWAMLGDILIAEPKATIGFAGRRVIQDTVRETLPEEFQTAEYVRDHGGIDLVIERQFLRSTISTLLTVLLKKTETQANTESSNAVTLDKSLQKSTKAL